MQFTDFIEAMAHTIGERFSVLDDKYVREILLQLQDDIEAELRDFYSIRYALIDPDTGQVESRRLFETYDEARRFAERPEHGNPDIAVILN